MQLAENTVVAGRFRLKRLIGRGGMGSVWEASHLRLDIPCAVKFMDLAAITEAYSRFEREAKAAAQLRSPHVVQILDHGVCDDGTPYIAMELLDGEDLGKRLTRLGRLSPPDLVHIIGQVSRALTKAHQLGIVHRDLKPDNIFLVRDDDREIAKVLDFGIAKSVGHDLSTGGSTKTGAMLGTPFYMSPEQAQGIKQVDSRSDLWALAIICFEALTGRRPFVSEALGDLLIQIIVTPLPIPSQFGPVPTGFDTWWLRAASRDPAQRFQTAREFADSLALVCGISQVSGVTDVPNLRHTMRTQPVTPRPTYPPPGPDRRNSSPAPAMTQSLPPPAIPGTGSPVSHSFPSLPPASPGSKAGLVLGAIGGGIVLLAVLVFGAMALRSRPPVTNAGGGPSATPDPIVAASAPSASVAVDTQPKPQPSVKDSVPDTVTLLTPPVAPPDPSQAPTAPTVSVVHPVLPPRANLGGAPPHITSPQPKHYNSGI
jgi:serine/threonine protein kinase